MSRGSDASKGHLGNQLQQRNWKLGSWRPVEGAVRSTHCNGPEAFCLAAREEAARNSVKDSQAPPQNCDLTQVKDFLNENSLNNVGNSKVWTTSYKAWWSKILRTIWIHQSSRRRVVVLCGLYRSTQSRRDCHPLNLGSRGDQMYGSSDRTPEKLS